MKIGRHEIGKEPFLIAEAGLNTNGDIKTALEMVRAAAGAGVDAVKFQTFKTEEFCQPDDPMFPAFKRAELPDDAWPILAEECERFGVVFLSTPQNVSDLDLLISTTDLKAIKVGSDDLTNLPLLKAYAKRGLPMIMSTGMSCREEIRAALDATRGTDRALLICTSQYPCPIKEANLARLRTMPWDFLMAAEVKSVPLGFSDHTETHQAAIMAAALGACIFECHFTLNKKAIGPDHAWSHSVESLAGWVNAIRRTKVMLGSGRLEPSEKELEQKRKYQRRAGEQLRGSGEATGR